MKNKQSALSLFSESSLTLDDDDMSLVEFHERPVSDSLGLHEGLLIMVSKLMEVTRVLSKFVQSGSITQMEKCLKLAKQVHYLEKILTGAVVESNIKGNLGKGLITIPYRLERVGDMLESILSSCRIKAQDSVSFSQEAHAELEQLFATLMIIMGDLREAFRIPKKVLLHEALTKVSQLDTLIGQFEQAHWERLERGACSVEASSIYGNILDSAKQTSGHLELIARTLLVLTQKRGARTGSVVAV